VRPSWLLLYRMGAAAQARAGCTACNGECGIGAAISCGSSTALYLFRGLFYAELRVRDTVLETRLGSTNWGRCL
jgi:hypothetical protein